MIKLSTILKEVLSEATIGDITVVPSKGVQRGTSESNARSFDIIIDNQDVIKKMKSTPMKSVGSATAFSYEGPGGKTFTDFDWNADTSQWDVWQNMNYVSLTPKNYVHWYHGKMPGGKFTDDNGDLRPGSTGTPLPDLTVDRFGYKVYKALLLDPSVGFIKSEKGSTPAVKKSIYKHLMMDDDLIWISAGGTGTLDYDDIMVINPSHANVKKLASDFKEENTDKQIHRSKNFPILKGVILERGVIKIDPVELNKSEELYKYIADNFDSLYEKTKGRSLNNPHFDNKILPFGFQVQQIKGKSVPIGLGFYNDPKDFGALRADVVDTVGIGQRNISLKKRVILINLGHQIGSLREFKKQIYHELVHAVDINTYPADAAEKERKKTTTQAILKNKLSKNAADNFKLYASHVTEFNAFLSSIIATMKVNLELVDASDKNEYKQGIYRFIKDLKNKDEDDILNDNSYKEQIKFILGDDSDGFYILDIRVLQIYMQNEKLSKELLQKLFSAGLVKS
jgi:hypothetical protein